MLRDRFITLRGVRQHNLKEINVDLPKDKLTVITGPSGCGKSSLAFHTLYTEGQRRYLESLGTGAQRTLKGLEKPDYDFIDGLCPTIALKQIENQVPRGTTVAMMTEVYSYLSLLYSTLGVPHDPETGEVLEQLTSAEILTRLCKYPERTKLMLLAPLRGSPTDDLDALKEDLRRQGFMRVARGGKVYELDEEWEEGGDLSVVVDRVLVKEGVSARLADSLEVALTIHPSGVKALLMPPEEEQWQEVSFTTSYHNPRTGFILHRLEASCFRFSSRSSHCRSCTGLGRVDGQKCSTCQGGRLLPDYLAVTLSAGKEEKGISDLCGQSVEEAEAFISGVSHEGALQSVTEEISSQLLRRLKFLREVGLGYLRLNQWGAELSTGEYQRLRLASQLGSGLSGVLYVLDEPTRGLHASDTVRLIEALYKLRDAGNTVVVVEHEARLIMAADWMIDLGPGAGENGGEILAVGTPQELMQSDHSPTGKWLRKAEEEVSPKASQSVSSYLEIKNACKNNLKQISVKFPIGALSVVDGVSGSGKSSLITDTLAPYALHKLNKGAPFTPEAEILGLEHFHRVVVVDQSPIGRSPRSSAATYTGLLDPLRTLYASLPLSKQRGYSSSRFSFNVKGGRCEKCTGSGKIHVELDFLNDAYVECDACHGARYNRETLDVRYKGRNIAEVLSASITENLAHFKLHPKISTTLEALVSVGLGYLRLGQGAHTLSGGEAQRVKIATELIKGGGSEARRGRKEETLYLLDEPTRGLHFMDVDVLGEALRSLLDGKNTIIVIEHNPQFLHYADHRVTLGHGGGEAGGYVV